MYFCMHAGLIQTLPIYKNLYIHNCIMLKSNITKPHTKIKAFTRKTVLILYVYEYGIVWWSNINCRLFNGPCSMRPHVMLQWCGGTILFF